MRLPTFPNPVNDKAARTVATGVLVLGVATLLTASPWLALVLAAGFALRVAAGPRWSPLGLLATRVIAPRLGAARLVPGPPKRFAQAIGLTFTAVVTALLFAGQDVAAGILLGVLLVAAFLESVVGFCVGCWMFGLLMRAGVIPRSVCLACANVAYEL
jgi:hypothetical protein